MSDVIKIGELEVEVLDLTRRLDRIEGDQSKFDTRLKNIEEQVTTFNSNMKRFWERDWPTIEKAMDLTNEKLGALEKENIEARVKIAIEATQDKYLIAGLQDKIQVLEDEVKSQRSVLIKLLLSAAAGGSTVVAIAQVIQHLLGG
jgi:predicted nuclease with TOPRIM domain